MKKDFSKKEWFVILFFTMALWGTLAPATRILSHLSQSLLALIRLGVASMAFAIFTILTKRKFRIRKKDFSRVFILGVLAGYIPPVLFNLGVKNTSSIIGAILINTSSIFIPFVSIALGLGRFEIKKFFYALMGAIGIAIFSLSKSLGVSLENSYLIGILLLVLGALSIAINTVLSKELVKKYGGIEMAGAIMFIGFGCLLVHTLMTGEIMSFSLLSAKDLIVAVYIGLVPTALTWIIFLASLKKLLAIEAAIFKLLIPVFAALFSVLLLKEKLSGNIFFGAAIILVSIYLMQKDTIISGTDVE